MVATYFFFADSVLGQFGELGKIAQQFAGSAFRRSIFDFFSFKDLISAAISGLIGGLIFAVILSKAYSWVMGFQKRVLGNKFNTLFKILFWPAAIVSLVLLLIDSGSTGFGWLAVSFVGDVIAYFIYARMIEKSVGQYYPQV